MKTPSMIPVTDRCLEPQHFTLLELLVVVSIIAILASLVLPALSRSRDKVRGVVCLNNLKQCHLGFMNYMDDSDGYIPAFNTGIPWYYHLTNNPYDGYAEHGYIPAFSGNGFLYYAATPEAFSANRKKAGPLICPVSRDYKTYVMDYGMNFWLREWAGTHYVGGGTEMNGYIKSVHVEESANAILLGEPINSFYLAYTNNQLAQAAIYRHSGVTSNALYFDGHASSNSIIHNILRLPASERP